MNPLNYSPDGSNGSVRSADGSVDHGAPCAKCRCPRWKHKHDGACQNGACSCVTFRDGSRPENNPSSGQPQAPEQNPAAGSWELDGSSVERDAILLELDTEAERYTSLIEETAEDFADDEDGGEEMAGMFEDDQADIVRLRDLFAAGDFDAVRSTILDTNPREMLAENCPTFAAWFARTRTPDQHLF